jgi:uroporphyrinogen III methyltransferase/synthase
MTLKAKRLLAEADAVLYDRLLNPEMLEGLDAELIDVGKAAGDHKLSQEEINQLLIKKAEEGKRVVRLKGGDPYLFGRGGEEALALMEQGIPVEIVPGVTSAIAAPALAGIPVTHRGIASSLTIVTGHEEPGKESPLDWGALARLGGTIVILMGVSRIEENVHALLAGGRAAVTPAAIVEKGGWPDQRLIAGTLGDIAGRAREAGVRPPAILVVGDVVLLSRLLKPKKIAILRPEAQQEESRELAEEYGLIPVSAPAIAIVERPPRPDLIQRLRDTDCVVFTSANGVEMALRDPELRASLEEKMVAAIGPRTMRALARHGLQALVPEEYSSAGLLQLLQGLCRRVLLLRSGQGGQELAEGLRALGLDVEEVPLYDVAPSGDPRLDELIAQASSIDVFAFTSSSTVRCLMQRARELGQEGTLREALARSTVAAIGPPTALELERLGVRVDVMPERFTFESLLQALGRRA